MTEPAVLEELANLALDRTKAELSRVIQLVDDIDECQQIVTFVCVNALASMMVTMSRDKEDFDKLDGIVCEVLNKTLDLIRSESEDLFKEKRREGA